MTDPIKRAPEQAPRAPELRPETGPLIERAQSAPRTTESERPSPAVAPTTPIGRPETSAPTPAKDPLVARIETILEEDLAEVYFKMTPAEQAAFKKKGEETTTKIQLLLGKASVKAKEILRLIADWLRFIPGVNRFFLEQEAKIKTDKIMRLKK